MNYMKLHAHHDANGIMMGHRDSYNLNFESALKLEVDPAARRPGVTVTPVPTPSARQYAGGHGHGHGATNSTGQCLGQRQV